MVINDLNSRSDLTPEGKLSKRYIQFENLIHELKKRELPEEVANPINAEIEQINLISGNQKELGKQLKKAQSRILKNLEKKLKLVPKNHYRNTWLMVGMAVFGLPIGVVFGTSLGNMALLGIGLPLGMAVGYGVGASLDKKAREKGNQLDLEIKY